MSKTAEDAGLAVIGAAHWDILGRADCAMTLGADTPGRITRRLGGVAAAVAAGLVTQDMAPVLFAAVGTDREGDLLAGAIAKAGLQTDGIVRTDGSQTDSCLVIEDQTSMIAAVADCRCLEQSEAVLMEKLAHWLPRRARQPTVAVDGNMSPCFLNELCRIRKDAGFGLIYLAASPKKAERARRLAGERAITLYLNRFEAAALCGTAFGGSRDAALALIESGYERVIVTDSHRAATDADIREVISVPPEAPLAAGVTGAGDRFAAGHIAGSLRGLDRRRVMQIAHVAAANKPKGTDV